MLFGYLFVTYGESEPKLDNVVALQLFDQRDELSSVMQAVSTSPLHPTEPPFGQLHELSWVRGGHDILQACFRRLLLRVLQRAMVLRGMVQEEDEEGSWDDEEGFIEEEDEGEGKQQQEVQEREQAQDQQQQAKQEQQQQRDEEQQQQQQVKEVESTEQQQQAEADGALHQQPSTVQAGKSACAACGKTRAADGVKLRVCTGCGLARYCSVSMWLVS